MYEIPVLAIVNEVYFRMQYNYDELLQTSTIYREVYESQRKGGDE